MDKEFRFYESDEIEIREDGQEEDKWHFVEGIGVVYDREVEIFPRFMERIRPGAFETSLRSQQKIQSYFNHNPSFVLSTTKSRPPLVLQDGPTGLRFRAPIPPTTYGMDLKVNLERKNVNGASLTFWCEPGGDILTRDEKGVLHREVVKAKLFEVGPVTNPAYAKTTASLRSAEAAYRECVERYEAANAGTGQAEHELRLMEMYTESL